MSVSPICVCVRVSGRMPETRNQKRKREQEGARVKWEAEETELKEEDRVQAEHPEMADRQDIRDLQEQLRNLQHALGVQTQRGDDTQVMLDARLQDCRNLTGVIDQMRARANVVEPDKRTIFN